MKLLQWAVGLAWTAGVGVAGYAIAQENRITKLEEAREQAVKEQTQLKSSTDKLTDVVVELNTSLKLLRKEIEVRREYETVSEEPER